MRFANSGYIGVDKRSAKAGVYGLRKHILERYLGNFYGPAAAAAAASGATFNIDVRDTLANIRARTGDAVGVIAFVTTAPNQYDILVYDGTHWQIYYDL
jgi:hypothetical protein